ncbi:MAG: protein-disulfide reductase DsbD family protein [Bacteroidota bacterium]
MPVAIGQEVSADSPSWKVQAEKVNAQQYRLVFSASVNGGWTVYIPQQLIFDQPAAQIQFGDSSIQLVEPLNHEGRAQRINSELLSQEVEWQQGNITWSTLIEIKGVVPAAIQGTLLYTYGRDAEIYPATPSVFVVPLEGGQAQENIRRSSIQLASPIAPCGDQGTSQKSLWSIFLLGVLGGLIALLTPCVFPMVPVTVTFFTKKSNDRRQGIVNALLYGSFILLIYVLLTVPFHVAGKAISPEVFNNISTNVWLNLLFFAVFIVFALSFFGLFEIGLPAGFANRMDSRAGLGNIGGIFFMASTLAIVSFSCTGPILGTLLVGVAEQGAWPLTVGAAGFGLALGLPFGLFALFPNWLQSLPRSGGWMTDVKIVLGFIELGLAIKFLSNADLVEQWGILKREIFIGSWVIIGIFITLYLAGFLRIGQHRVGGSSSLFRYFFLLLFGSFTLYLIPGLTKTKYAELELISGFPPPMTYSLYENQSMSRSIFKPLHNEYEKALELAAAAGKPVLIDFTGWACVNCRRMEEKVWTDPRVDSLLRNAFVVVSLYVDERVKLPLAEQQTIKLPDGSSKQIETVGDKWASFQIQNFGATSQPQYAMLTPDEKLLSLPKFYTPDPAAFLDWLECGLNAFATQQKK